MRVAVTVIVDSCSAGFLSWSCASAGIAAAKAQRLMPTPMIRRMNCDPFC